MTDNVENDNNLINNVHSQCPNNNINQNRQLYSTNLERDKYIQSLNAWITEAWQWQNYTLRVPYYYLLNQVNQTDNMQGNVNNIPYLRRPNLSNNNAAPQNRTATGKLFHKYVTVVMYITICYTYF